MTNNTLENQIEQLVNREIYLNQSHLVEELILKPNPEWIEYIENFYDESSEAVEDYLTWMYMSAWTWRKRKALNLFPRTSLNGGWSPTGWPTSYRNSNNRFWRWNTAPGGDAPALARPSRWTM